MRFASNELDRYEPPACPRCGIRASFDWIAVAKLSAPTLMHVPGRHWCDTPGCLDEHGYNSVPMPRRGKSL